MSIPSSACSALTIMQYVWDGGPSSEEVWEMVLAWWGGGGWETWRTQLPLRTGLIWATTPWFISDSGSVGTASEGVRFKKVTCYPTDKYAFLLCLFTQKKQTISSEIDKIHSFKLCYRVCQLSPFEWPFSYTFWDLLQHMGYRQVSTHPTCPPFRVTFAAVHPSYLRVKVGFHPW